MEIPLDDTVRVARFADIGGSGTHRLSLIGLNTIVHRPHKMAMEDMVNVCTHYILFHWSVCLFGGFVGEGVTTHQRLPIWWDTFKTRNTK